MFSTLDVIKRNDQRIRLIQEGNINEDSTREPQPADIPTSLYPHQLTALNRLKKAEQQGGIYGEDDALYFTRLGIYGDLVGSGKSLTILALAASGSVVPSITHEKRACGSDYYVETPVSPRPKELKASVIVVPHHLVSQWTFYAGKDLPSSLTCKVISRVQDIGQVLDDIDNIDVIICDCTYFNVLAKRLHDVASVVNRVCFDEADTLRIPACENMDSKFTWFITASVKHLVLPPLYKTTAWDGSIEVNSLDYYNRGLKHRGYITNKAKNLFSCTQDISPFLVINDPAFIESSLRLPKPVRISHRCEESQMMSLLRGIISDGNMHDLYANNTRSALGVSRDSIVAKENMFDALQDSIRQELSNERAWLAYNQNYRGRPAPVQEGILNDINAKIQALEKKLTTLEERLNSTNLQCCPICFDDLHTPMCVLKCCNTMFCLPCWSKLQGADFTGYYKCPMCRALMPENMIISDRVEKVKSKNDIVVDIINDKRDGSFIIFNEHDPSLQKLSSVLRLERISHSTLDQNSKRAARVCEDFQNGKVKVLLLNAQQMATGLNLTEASDVILTHRMNKDMEMQAIGRCMRVGRRIPLSVHQIAYDSEI